jgi:hypothetical protein
LAGQINSQIYSNSGTVLGKGVKVRVKFSITSHGNSERDGILGFHHYLHIQNNQDGRVVSCMCRPHFTPKEIPWYSFLLEAEWTPELLTWRGLNDLKISTDPTGIQKQDLLSCDAVAQSTARTRGRTEK